MISGGVALADASISTGLAIYLGGKLSILKVLPNILIMIITCILTSILTEFVTAGACANILIPILIEMVCIFNIIIFLNLFNSSLNLRRFSKHLCL